jgi:hypothetical protein
MFSALAGSMSTALPMGADAAVLLKLGHAELDVGTRVVVVSREVYACVRRFDVRMPS